MPHDYIVTPGSSRPIAGAVTVPGDKSISHRAAILAALGEGPVTIHGFLDGEDCRNTLRAIASLGIDVEAGANTAEGRGSITIHGRGLCGLSAPAAVIDCGNSGTGLRLLAGLLAAQPFDSELCGDESLQRRPMGRIIDPLQLMGARIDATDGKPPLRIHGRQELQAIHYELPMASAQVKSAILLAGLAAGVPVSVSEPATSRDHTERMLAACGVGIEKTGNTVRLDPVPRLAVPRAIRIPRDLSSAAFWLVLAAISDESEIRTGRVGVNPTRSGVLQLLQRMSAKLQIDNESEQSGEPVADITSSTTGLRAIDIDADDVSLAIDEIPILLIAAACANGTTRLRGAAELRVKESDRLSAMAAGLRAMGIRVEEYPDGLDVTGGVLQGGEVDSHGDHRIAMAFAVAAAVASGPVRIRHIDNVATSYPAFRRDMAALGIEIQEIEGTA